MLAESAAAVAGICRADVAIVGARGAVRLLGVGRAGLTRYPGARLDHVALPGGCPAHRAAGCNDIGGTALGRPVAGLSGVAHIARAGATDEAIGLHGVSGTGGAAPRACF